MNGEFHTDITRDTFHLHKHFSRVLMQQGRVQLDSDWNEQVDILLHYLRTLVAGVVGPHGGFDDGFKVGQYTKVEQAQETARGKRARQKAPETPQTTDVPYHLLISGGHYYVNGILCENEHEYVYTIPPSMRPDAEQSGAKAAPGEQPLSCYLYLDVWEREVTWLEDALIREVALGGPDTTTRSQVVWKIRAKSESEVDNAPKADDIEGWTKLMQQWHDVDRGHLQAQTIDVEQSSKEPCAVPPTSHYRGLENQLYRVEIHEGGDIASHPTFKWSRENGAVMFPIIGPVTGGENQTSLTLTLGNLGRDDSRFGLDVDDWVEIIAVEDELEDEPGPLMRVQSIDLASRQVTLVSHDHKKGVTIPNNALFLRRWDYHRGDPGDKHMPVIAESGALQIVEDIWLTLEDGIEILFVAENATYRTGNYWLIPARTATGKIEWPRHNNQADRLPPHGVKHYYAPLCHASLVGGVIHDPATDLHDLRRVFNPFAPTK